ncbi:MAG: trifunctional transcriptional activator/DNA repair protein Ada/methylated-DNA--[protein]-cysteine S-methyltransferase [Candidatus Krumholzibacteria bacterium]|nr:trifunctional transcriptional activator/DNA repair protein Ada/methylated-DNA--[protein]-cysteine S-methyltransferase [Candidatus Krumholzibacteria bacterium]
MPISKREMYEALQNKDSTYDRLFVVGVKTTGIFCRPTCPARKPKEENVEFFPSVREALSAGYRACKRCRPMEPNGAVPPWLRELIDMVNRDPGKRWTDADLRGMSIDPSRARRWFRTHYGMTFHAFHRARRLGRAFERIRSGSNQIMTAFDHGYESLSGFRDAFERAFGTTPGKSEAATCVVTTRFLTPLGPMIAGATEKGVCLLEFSDRRMLETQIKRLRKWLGYRFVPGNNDHLSRLNDQLEDYFAGTLKAFSIDMVIPGSEFQRAVWQSLQKIPYGCTWTYEQLARHIGKPNAQRAVGRANGDNRLAIVIPCHRVVRADGSLCGYGGGLWRKKHLLDLENSTSNR